MKKISLILDFDGTVADTQAIALDIYNNMARQHGFLQLTTEKLKEIKNLPLLSVAKILKVPVYKLPRLLAQGRRMMQEKSVKAKWFRGLPEVFKKLHNQGVEFYIASSNSEQNIKDFFARAKFTHIRGIEHSSSLFGKHYQIKKITTKYQLDKNLVYYIGDEIRDVEAGKRAGVKTIAVSWGYNSKNGLALAKPDHLITRPSELLVVLPKI